MPKRKKKKSNCKVEFLNHYITSLELILKFRKTKEIGLKNQIIEECNKVIKQPPSIFEEGHRTLASFYHSIKENDKAEYYAKEAININNMNSIAHFILYSIYEQKKMTEEMQQKFVKLLFYSPYLVKPFPIL